MIPAIDMILNSASPRSELLTPVRYVGQTALRSQAHYIASTYQHYVGLICQHLESFNSLVDGWDGYDSVVPSAHVITRATSLVVSLSSNWAMRLKIEDIMPTPYGTITLEWRSEDTDYFGVEIGEESWALFGKVKGKVISKTMRAHQRALLMPAIEMLLQALHPTVQPQHRLICAYSY